MAQFETVRWKEFIRHITGAPEAGVRATAGIERPPLGRLLLFYVAYVIAGSFAAKLQIIPGHTTAFWPPAGIFVATLLTNRAQVWWWYVLAGCLAELTCNIIWFGNALPAALGFYSANALEALAATWMLKRFVADPFKLETPKEAAGLVLAAAIAPIIGATVGSATHALLGTRSFTSVWGLWWLGDASGLLVTAPLALAALLAWQSRTEIPVNRLIEATLLSVILVGVSALAFTGYLPTAYAVLPPLLWIALRFRLIGAAAAVAAIALLTAEFTLVGAGEFSGQPERMKEKVIALQSFLALSAISALLVAVLSHQHQQALQRAIVANDELETRVAERTAELAENEERLRLLMREMSHRDKNMLVLVQAVARQTAASEPADFVERFSQRLRSLAVNHDLLTKNVWKGIALDELVRSQLAHFADLMDRRIAVTGPPVALSSRAAQSIGMVVHELATNAVKHGALSNEKGRIDISWALEPSRFVMSWKETDGPAVAPGTRKGFGTIVTTTMVESAVNANVKAGFAGSGFEWTLECAPENVLEGPDQASELDKAS